MWWVYELGYRTTDWCVGEEGGGECMNWVTARLFGVWVGGGGEEFWIVILFNLSDLTVIHHGGFLKAFL